jgi:membrane protein implicated in regulation of membrane protease activity
MFGFLLSWYNIPFLVALGCCLLVALLQLIGGGSNQDVDADIDADVDADGIIDTTVDLSADAHGHGSSALGTALSALGIGRVPLILVLTAFLGSFGAIGLILNTLLANILGDYPPVAFPLLLGAAAILALPLTSVISRSLGRIAPEMSTAIGYEQLVGRVGVVVSATVSRSYGRVQVRDGFGTLHTVFAVVSDGEPLAERSEVALLTYDASQRRFVVGTLDPVRH